MYKRQKLVNKSDFWKSQITQLHFYDNEFIIIPRVGDHKIYFGELLNINSKLENLFQFYTKVIPTKGWQKYKNVILKYENQIVCTKR